MKDGQKVQIEKIFPKMNKNDNKKMFKILFEVGGYDHIIFFDCETTGLDAVGEDQMIELAGIAMDRDGVIKSMDKYIKLFNRYALFGGVPLEVIKLTGIDTFTLDTEGIQEKDALEIFFSLFGEKNLLVAYNAHFDLLYMAVAALRYKGQNPDFLKKFNRADYLDPCSVFRDRVRQIKTHKLNDAIDYFNLNGRVQNTHRAIDDTEALKEVTLALESEKDDLVQYINRFSWVKCPPEHPLKKVFYYDLTPWHNFPRGLLYERTW